MGGGADPASGSSSTADTAARAPLGFAVTFADGKGLLGLGARRLSRIGRLERLELEIPELRFPFDLSGGVDRFQSRRCRARDVGLSVDGVELESWIRSAQLAQLGLSRLRVELGGGLVRLVARGSVGDRACDVVFVAAPRVEGPRRLRLSLFDVRVYGFLPLPAPLLASALLGRLAAAVARPGRPLVEQLGPTDLQLDPLDLALYDLLPRHGWRLPAREHLGLAPPTLAQTAAAGVDAPGGRATLRYTPASGDAEEPTLFELAEPSARTGELAAYEEGRTLLPEAERAIVAGDLGAAIAAYRRGVIVHPTSSFVTGRVLQLLVASPATWGEADELASAALARTPELASARAVKAIVASERADHATAAGLWRRLAEDAEAAGAPTEAACARTAAAEAALRGGDVEAARADLERARALRPAHPRAIELLAERLRDERRWEELVRLLQEAALEERDPSARARLLGESAGALAAHLDDPARARERFEQALHLDPTEASLWEGLGRVHRALGETGDAEEAFERARGLRAARGEREAERRILVDLAATYEARGDVDAAIAALERATSDGSSDPAALGELARLLAAHERAPDAIAALERALEGSRDPDARRRLRLAIASIAAGAGQDAARARLRLEEVLTEAPSDPEALEQLAALLGPAHVGELEVYVRRALARTDARDRRVYLLRRLRDVARGAEDAADVLFAALVDLVAEGGDEAVAHARELADRAASSADRERLAQARRVVERASAATEDGRAGAELAFVEAKLAEATGDDADAIAALRTCLAKDARDELAAGAWRRLTELLDRSGDAAAAAQALMASADDARTGLDESARAASLVAAAELMRDRLGLPQDAIGLLERAASLDPTSAAAFAALEATARSLRDWTRVEDVLARQLESARSFDRLSLLGRMGELFAGPAGKPEAADEAFRRALDIDPEYGPGLLYLARRGWLRGDQTVAAELFARLLALADREGGEAPAPAARAEAHLRLAQWARLVGQLDDAEEHLAAGIASEPDAGAPLATVVEVLEGADRIDELLDVLGRRADVATGDPRRELLATQASVLERLGRSEEAAGIHRRLLADDPDDVGALARLAEIYRREGRHAQLIEPLTKLHELARAPRGAGWLDDDGAPLDAEALGIELARLLSGAGEDAARAELVLREVLERHPRSAEAIEALAGLLRARGATDEADELLARRGTEAAVAGSTGARLLARARERLEGSEGEAAAYKLLRGAELGELPDEALDLRAALAEKRSALDDALVTLRERRKRAREASAEENVAVAARLRQLATRPGAPAALAIEILEELLAADDGDVRAAEGLADLYGSLLDPQARARALEALLERSRALPDARRAGIHALLAQLAIEQGDLVKAEAAHASALALALPPELRADHLVGRAAILVARKDAENAFADLEDALALVPHHAGALALVGDLAYRAQDWEEARRAYDALAEAPGWSEAVSAELLAFRRAELAEMFGDEAQAEAGYRRVAEINAQSLPAREALAQFATVRGDHVEAVRWLEQVLALAPLDEVDRIRDARLRLGEAELRVGALDEARHQLELVLADDPDSTRALELLAQVLEQLAEWDAATRLYERLARLYPDPRDAAAALYRQGDVFRTGLADANRAADAYLRSSDLDPGFGPTLARLVDHSWDRGELEAVVDVGRDVASHPEARELLQDQGRGVAIALAAIVAGDDGELASEALTGIEIVPGDAVQRLRELYRLRGPAGLHELVDGIAVIAPREPKPGSLLAAARIEVIADPASSDALVVFAILAERRRDRAGARGAWALLAFLDGGHGALARSRLVALGVEVRVRADALAPAALEHPMCVSALRRVLTALAPALAGVVDAGGRPGAGEPLPAELAERLVAIGQALGAPRFVPVRADADEVIAIVPSRPLELAVGDAFLALPTVELGFFAARAIDDLRSGTWALSALGAERLNELLLAVGRVLGGVGDGPSSPEGAHLARHLEELPSDPAVRDGIVADARAALASPFDLGRHLAGCEHLANRVALLACGQPLVAIAAVYASARGRRPRTDRPGTDPMLPVLAEARAELVREGSALRELVLFLFSAEYRALVEA